jgi:hypothetical protein
MNHKIKTVAEARQVGLKVKVTHHRLPTVYEDGTPVSVKDKVEWTDYNKKTWPDSAPNTPLAFGTFPRGGYTVVEVSAPGIGDTYGIAVCSFSDNYNRKTGAAKALERALDALASLLA